MPWTLLDNYCAHVKMLKSSKLEHLMLLNKLIKFNKYYNLISLNYEMLNHMSKIMKKTNSQKYMKK